MSDDRTQSPTADGEIGPYAAAAPFRRPERVSLLNRAIPVSEDLPNYRPHTARGDVARAEAPCTDARRGEERRSRNRIRSVR
jgi:hypothetical protein